LAALARAPPVSFQLMEITMPMLPNPDRRIRFENGELSTGEVVLQLVCLQIDTAGCKHIYWDFALSGEEYIRFLQEPLRRLECARRRKTKLAA
jgi:hypothetical protein